MRISDILSTGRPAFSFEFFPPKTEEGVKKLFDTMCLLSELDPSFVSITYGAGGTTRRLTVDLAYRIKRDLGLEVMAHLTCVNQTREEIRGIVQQLVDHGIENILALRGDPPKETGEFVPVEGGFSYANELIEFLSENFDVCLGAACYPEGHSENPSREDDLLRAKAKVDAGAEFLISQLFFDPAIFGRYRAAAEAIGITVPIMPGIMPVTNLHQLERFTTTIGASIPQPLYERLQRYHEDDQAVTAIGIEWALEQGRLLLESGAAGAHFYTLNKSLSTRIVCRALKLGLPHG
jgi:methylenetetrahydrofolate reductase (NADPH)